LVARNTFMDVPFRASGMPTRLLTEEKVIPLQTKEIACFFETDTGFLRCIQSGGVEVVRAIYGAVRDHNWGTVRPQIDIEQLVTETDLFRVEFRVRCEASEISFWWNGTVVGKGGSLFFRFDGEARSTFRKNRIGLCILHPIRECAGRVCQFQNSAGEWQSGQFPQYISPHQPFKDVRAISWQPANGMRANIQFEGDIFEMEDQRNWTDASFKTYCTPLELPYPKEISTGERIEQQVTLLIESDSQTVAVSPEPQLLTLSSSEKAIALPKLGIGAASHILGLSSSEIQRLSSLKLHHLRVDLHLNDPGWNAMLVQASNDAIAIGARLQGALFLDEAAESQLQSFRNAADPALFDVCFIFHEQERSTSAKWVELARSLLPGFQLVTGTNAYFAELNRQRPPRDFPACYSINPQVHAFDDLSLIENLEAQSATVESALQFCDRGLFISPITLRPRFNPNATSQTEEPKDRLPSTVDPRQRTLFGAVWTLGALAGLLPQRGITSLTFYETTGWQGLMETAQGSPLAELFGSAPGEIFPVYHVFHALADARSLIIPETRGPKELAALWTRGIEANSLQCLLGNLHQDFRSFELELPTKRIQLQILDETHLAAARLGRLPEPKTIETPDGRIRLDLSGYTLAFLRCA
jgi:hypothetical protein